MSAVKNAYQLQAQTVIKNMKKRGINGYYAADKEEALKTALSLMEKGSSVAAGGSATLTEIGLLDYVKDFICDIINTVRYSMSVFGNTYVTTTNGGAFYYILDMLRTIIIFIRDLFLILCGFAAFRNRNIRIPGIDGLVDRHMRSA